MPQTVAALGLFGLTPTDMYIRTVTDGDFGATPAALGTQGPWTGPAFQQTQNNTTYSLSIQNDGRTPNPPIYAHALDWNDWNQAFVCVRSGLWSPGRFRVDTSLGPMIAEYAITPKSNVLDDYPRWDW